MLACFHTQPVVLHLELRRNLSLQLKNLYQPVSCPNSICDCTVIQHIQVCYGPKQTASRSIMNQVHSLAEFREAGGCCIHGPPEKLQPWGSDGCECELMLVNMLELSFPQVLLFLTLWVNFRAYSHNSSCLKLHCW